MPIFILVTMLYATFLHVLGNIHNKIFIPMLKHILNKPYFIMWLLQIFIFYFYKWSFWPLSLWHCQICDRSYWPIHIYKERNLSITDNRVIKYQTLLYKSYDMSAQILNTFETLLFCYKNYKRLLLASWVFFLD